MFRLPFWKKQRIFKRLKTEVFSQEEITAWKDYIRGAEERELYQLNPRYIANKLDWTETKTLDMLIHSAVEDLWDISWEVYCPECDHLTQHAQNLGDVERFQWCEMCQAEGEVHLDDQITPRATISQDVQRISPSAQEDVAFRRNIDETLGRLPALHLVNRPSFREQLGAQVLPPNRSLGIQNLAVFFSDLKSSTELYQTLGDAAAYQLVRDHFREILHAVEEHDGGAVKTMGDGVMGTFHDPLAALLGVTKSIQRVRALNENLDLPPEEGLRLKVGLHLGSCIVVTLDGKLDYFGSTVNIAARLGEKAGGNEVWLSEVLLEQPGVREVAAKYPLEEQGEMILRGVEKKIRVYRLRTDTGEGFQEAARKGG